MSRFTRFTNMLSTGYKYMQAGIGMLIGLAVIVAGLLGALFIIGVGASLCATIIGSLFGIPMILGGMAIGAGSCALGNAIMASSAEIVGMDSGSLREVQGSFRGMQKGMQDKSTRWTEGVKGQMFSRGAPTAKNKKPEDPEPYRPIKARDIRAGEHQGPRIQRGSSDKSNPSSRGFAYDDDDWPRKRNNGGGRNTKN